MLEMLTRTPEVVMRFALLTAVGLLGALALPAAQPKPEAVTKEAIEADLKLVPKVFGDARVIEAGTQPYIEFKLVNASKTRTHKVVKPGDGSEVGWRDPWVRVTAEQRGVDGRWAALAPGISGRCGLFDSDWPKDVVELKPGAELPLTGWYHPSAFDFQFPGKVRLVGHYEYRATGGKDGAPRPDAKRGAMAGVPLFAVRSEPVEFDVVRPLDVRVKVKRALKVGVETKLSEVFEVSVFNAGDKPRTVGNISRNGYGIDIRPASDMVAAFPYQNVPVYSATRVLKPGEAAVVFGGGDFAGKVDGGWKASKPGTIRVRVGYSLRTDSSAAHVVYTEAEVRAEE